MIRTVFIGALLASLAGTVCAASLHGVGVLWDDRPVSSATVVSADGNTVGGIAWDKSFNYRAFRWTKNRGMTGLPGENSTQSSSVIGISPNGDTVAVAADGLALWSKDGAVVPLGAAYSAAPGFTIQTSMVSDTLDSAAGSMRVPGGVEAYLWTRNDGMVRIGRLPSERPEAKATGFSADGDVVVGWSTSNGGKVAFRWTRESGMVGIGVLHGPLSEAVGVSADGKVIAGNSGVPFRWTEAEGMIGLGTLPAGLVGVTATAISADGNTIVGQATNGPGVFVWSTGYGARRLVDVLQSRGVNVAGWKFKKANAVSADGSVIIGDGEYKGVAQGFVANLK